MGRRMDMEKGVVCQEEEGGIGILGLVSMVDQGTVKVKEGAKEGGGVGSVFFSSRIRRRLCATRRLLYFNEGVTDYYQKQLEE